MFQLLLSALTRAFPALPGKRALPALVFCVFLLTGAAYPCSSDCYQCHEIPKDSEHKVLSTCTKCHPEHSEKDFRGKCGADCFECHDYKKVMTLSQAHSVLKKCIECHKGLEKGSPIFKEPLENLLSLDGG